MLNEVKVQCPAKINLNLKVFKKDEKTGFHNIESIMQAINLFDYITIKIEDGNEIILKGNSNEIPYNDKNICYKAVELFLKEINQKRKVSIEIEKNIPVCAGLAGGSTDAAGVLVGLNELFNNVLQKEKIHFLASKLGSDLNFCLEGGKKLCLNRGEILKEEEFKEFNLVLIKPKNLKISAREAYEAFDNLDETSNMPNDLEYALLKTKKYEELSYLSSLNFQMSGSGPTYFLRNVTNLKKDLKDKLNPQKFLIIENLCAIPCGTRII